ncbi:MAG TPA: hypothetical protein VNM89_07445, partial [Solirubrobacterales bacterium]|nr:hypothetical protein [Solirubrobacterales bacterium]
MTRPPQSAAPFLSLTRSAILTFATLALTLFAFAPAASAKEAVDIIADAGGAGVAVNDSGAGPANAGDVYVIDGGSPSASGNRIQRFGRDDNGTPGNTPAATADDTYFFISAWGADVDSTTSGGSDYEICTVAAACQAAVPSGGNGTAAGNGALNLQAFAAGAIAVDQDTGNVFVTDSVNNRVNVYDGAGTFLRSFGFDIAASGPGDTGTGYEVCVAADGDVCKAGTSGSAVGQLGTATVSGSVIRARAIAVGAPDGNPTTGAVYLADSANNRVNTYGLDGFSPGSIGSAADFAPGSPDLVAVDSRGILYATDRVEVFLFGADSRILRYDTANANGGGIGFLAPFRSSISEGQQLNRNATGGQFRLSFGVDTTGDLSFNATPEQVRAALEALPSMGAGNIRVATCSCGEGFYIVRFTDDLANADVPQLVVSNGTTPLTGTISVTTAFDGFGGGGANEVQEVTIAATAGTFTLSFDSDGGGPGPAETTRPLPFNAPAQNNGIRDALEELPSIGEGDVGQPDGRGDATGSNPYRITFSNVLGARDVAQLSVDGSGLSGGAGASVATVIPGQSGLIPLSFGDTDGLAVDPDSDGIGPDADVLYVSRNDVIQQFGPLNAPGLSAPPADEDDRHNTNGGASVGGLAVEPATGRLYATAAGGVYVIDEAGPPPTASLDSVDNVTATCADLHATIDPNGPPLVSYHFEYSDDGGSSWDSTPEVALGIQTDPQAIDETFCPELLGLLPNTDYLVRLVTTKRFTPPITTAALPFRTDPAPPIAETAGAPVRSTTSAQINGRVTPLGSATTYHFEYGDQGPCSANPCASTPTSAAGSGYTAQLVAEELGGIAPDTTYHYRLLASNGVGSPLPGEDMSVTTRASDVLPGQSDAFPGPPGSDRAWEMVSLAESSGNPVGAFFGDAFSDDGDRAVYGIAGGTPIAPTGSFLSPYFAERTPSGWQTRPILPPRDQLVGQEWGPIYASSDLSTMVTANAGTDSGREETEFWRLTPGSGTTLLYRGGPESVTNAGISADGTLAAAVLGDSAPDPAYPGVSGLNAYLLGAGAPQLASLLPGGGPGPCGTQAPPLGAVADSNWVAPEGVYFETPSAPPCGTSPTQLYLRDPLAAQSRLVSGPLLSGPDCGGSLIKATPGAAFFATASRLDSEDTEAAGCAIGNDIYRYDTSDDSLECLTCIVPGSHTQVSGNDATAIGVAEDGSRVYFGAKRLTPDSQGGAYRLDVASGEIAYVGPVAVGSAQPSVALSSDGSVLVFASDDASLNPLGGTSDNGSGTQYYRYDDTDRSLICVSCPQDGSPPLEELDGGLHKVIAGLNNNRALSADGGTLAFVTTTPLAGADQNTPAAGDLLPGTDVYEWRDGRQILVTDGLTNWAVAPIVEGVSPDGADVFFDATAAYTPDAPDALIRLYTARVGGGIEFPPEGLPPCDLNAGACEGPPS